ncbi:MAG: SDR family oxidoreductase [Bdellovibrionales bacterium]
MNVVITGTSRGIGLELTYLALVEGHKVAAVAREPDQSKGLQALFKEYPLQLEIITADVSQPDGVQKILDAVKSWGKVDVLINNAGILRKDDTRQDFIDSFQVNSIAPYEVTMALLPLLQKGDQPRVINVTSKMGSISDNTSGRYFSYRASKAALNMITKSLAQDHNWLKSIVIHPGWVQTDMGGPQAPTSVRDSASGIWKVANRLTKSDSGHFLEYTGKPIPW